MFSDRKTKTNGVIGNQQNRITEETVLSGDFFAQSGVRIDGTIDGNVRSSSKVVVGEKGVIKGTLECENADVEGKIYGKILVTDTLSLKSQAVIEGEVVVGKLSIEPGANFNASCVMKGAVKNLNKGKSIEEESTHSLKTSNS